MFISSGSPAQQPGHQWVPTHGQKQQTTEPGLFCPLGIPGLSLGLSIRSRQEREEYSGYQEHNTGLPAAPMSHGSAFGNAWPGGLGMNITKALGNNALLRFGTQLHALQNVIKILLMGQRGVEMRSRKAARSWRAHMGAGRPYVQRGEGGKQPGQASVPF